MLKIMQCFKYSPSFYWSLSICNLLFNISLVLYILHENTESFVSRFVYIEIINKKLIIKVRHIFFALIKHIGKISAFVNNCFKSLMEVERKNMMTQ